MTPPTESAASPAARTRRFPRWGKAGLGVLALVAAWAILFPNCETERVLTEQCSACFAGRRSAESGLWVHGSRWIGGATAVEANPGPYPELAALLGGAHAHRWFFAGMRHSCLGIAIGYSCGGGAFNPVALSLGDDPVNRAGAEARVASGEFRREEVVGILELPRVPTVEDRRDPARLHLFRRGQDLLRSIGSEEWDAWPGLAETVHPAECACGGKR